MKNEKLVKLLPYVVVLAIAAGLYYSVVHLNFSAPEGRLGPDAWPRLILILMMVACSYEIVRVLFAGEKQELEGVLESIIEETAEVENGEAGGEKTYSHLLVLGIVVTVIYVAVLTILGFFLSTALYLAIFMVLGRYRRTGVIIATSVLGSLAFVVLFMKIVYVSLPLGAGPFLTLSVAILRLIGIS